MHAHIHVHVHVYATCKARNTLLQNVVRALCGNSLCKNSLPV